MRLFGNCTKHSKFKPNKEKTSKRFEKSMTSRLLQCTYGIKEKKKKQKKYKLNE